MSILSERRSFQPYGLHGGNPGSRGINLLTFASRSNEDGSISDGKTVSLGGKNTVAVNKHDRLTILTPGGGGYGREISETTTRFPDTQNRQVMTSGSLHSYTLSQESA